MNALSKSLKGSGLLDFDRFSKIEDSRVEEIEELADGNSRKLVVKKKMMSAKPNMSVITKVLLMDFNCILVREIPKKKFPANSLFFH